MLQQLLQWDERITLWLNDSNSLFFDEFFMTVTSTVTWLPLILVLLYVVICNNNFFHVVMIVLFLGLCVFFADQMASGICKPYFERLRPTQDPSLMYALDVVDGYRGGLYGFFSSHAANTFAVAMFVSLLMRSRALNFMLFSWAILNGWSRNYLGVHYFGDVLVGTIWGCLVGAVMYWVYSRMCKPALRTGDRNTSSVYTVANYARAKVDLLTCSFALTYLYVAFRALF